MRQAVICAHLCVCLECVASVLRRVQPPPYCCKGLHTQLTQRSRVLKGGHLTTQELQPAATNTKTNSSSTCCAKIDVSAQLLHMAQVPVGAPTAQELQQRTAAQKQQRFSPCVQHASTTAAAATAAAALRCLAPAALRPEGQELQAAANEVGTHAAAAEVRRSDWQHASTAAAADKHREGRQPHNTASARSSSNP